MSFILALAFVAATLNIISEIFNCLENGHRQYSSDE